MRKDDNMVSALNLSAAYLPLPVKSSGSFKFIFFVIDIYKYYYDIYQLAIMSTYLLHLLSVLDVMRIFSFKRCIFSCIF